MSIFPLMMRLRLKLDAGTSPPVNVRLPETETSPVMLPPEMVTLESAFVPFPMPFMALATVVKSVSRLDSGMEDVAFANVYGIVIGSAIRTSLFVRIPFPSC